jgi:ubiquitin carboxyl-terminal hydrolase 5/13
MELPSVHNPVIGRYTYLIFFYSFDLLVYIIILMDSIILNSFFQCQKSGDTQNLWLNLSDGFIGGGRKHWDGSGGSNGALDHFVETGGQFPLVVKLGTITQDVHAADCYSYAPDEDCPVLVPNLAELLEKRGIHVAKM